MFPQPDQDCPNLVLPPCVVVHGLADMRLALSASRPITLLSAPGAAIFAGAGWWRALMILAKQDHTIEFYDVLDCADSPGQAMAAIRAGQRRLVLDPACPAFARVAATGALVLPERPPALDLAHRGAPRQLDAWLARPSAPSGADDDSRGRLR